MSISAKELAQQLQISPATVSMVLNHKPGISEATRKMVMDAAREHGYDFSRHLDGEEHGTLHFVIYKKHGHVVSDTPFFSQITEGIDSACKRLGYQLQISYVHESSSIREQLRLIDQSLCSGLLLLGTEMEAADLAPFLKLNLPIIVLDSYFENINCDTIVINNVQGAYLAARHLIEMGHRHIGYIRSNIPINNFAERADGYYKALRSYDLATSNPDVFRVTPTMEQACQDIDAYLMNNTKLASAYFADNDIIAAAAIRCFTAAGYRIPEDISVIGFDDMPICQYMTPQLTTMYVPKQRLGILAVERLIAKISGQASETIKIEVATKLLERGSVLKRQT